MRTNTALSDRYNSDPRTDLRVALHDLADVLLDRTYNRQQLLDAVRQAGVLADAADVRDGLVPTILRNLQRDLTGKAAIENTYFAQQLTTAADRL